MKKNNFLMYEEWGTLFQKLPNEEAGQLIKAIYDYLNGQSTDIDSPILSAVFDMIKTKIDADSEKYQRECERRSENVKKRWNKENTNEDEPIQVNTSVSSSIQENENYTDNDASLSLSLSLSKKDKEKGGAGEKGKEKKVRHKHGEYSHVLLTDDEYERLVRDYGESAVISGIKNVDEYCQEKGKTYNDYNLVLRKWGIKEPKIAGPPEKPPDKTEEPMNLWDDD